MFLNRTLISNQNTAKTHQLPVCQLHTQYRPWLGGAWALSLSSTHTPAGRAIRPISMVNI